MGQTSALERHRQALADARARRADVVSGLQQRVVRVLAQVETIEVRMCRAADGIVEQAHRRPRAQRSIDLSWRRARTRRLDSLALFQPCWRVRTAHAVERESQDPPSARQISRTIAPAHHEQALADRQTFLGLAKTRSRYLEAIGKVHKALGAEKVRKPTRGDSDFSEPIPRALPEHLSDLLHERRRRVGQILQALAARHDEIIEHEELIEDLMIAFNAEGKRNRNLSLKWRIGTWRHGVAIAGPECRQMYKTRTGRRYPRRIGDITARRLDWQRVRGAKQESTREAESPHGTENNGATDDARGGRPQTTIPMWVFTRTGQRRRAHALRKIFSQARSQAIERAQAMAKIHTADKTLPTAEEIDDGS